jgi:flagella basal body P-ring formation protein FlgA
VLTRGLVLAAALAGVGAAGTGTVVTPEEAIRTAVSERLRIPVSISVTDLETSVAGQAGLVARPDVAARLAMPARFVLEAGGVRRGLAVAVVVVRGRYPTASRSIARDEVIGLDAVDFIDGDFPPLRLREVIDDTGIAGLEARRAIAKGEPLTAAVLRVPPVVKSGDEVEVVVRMGRVRVTGTGLASGSGHVGDTIRVRMPHGARLLTGHIVGPGTVEIER